MAKNIPKEPLTWDGEWFHQLCYDLSRDRSGRYEIRRIREVAGVDVAAVKNLGRRVYVAQTLDLRQYEYVCLYVGFSEHRARRFCELHRLRSLAPKRRVVRAKY
jgi:hypothetical protein